MTAIPGYSVLERDKNDTLACSSTQNAKSGTPETTYYVYDYTDKRMRKVTESFAADGSASLPRVLRDTLYLAKVEMQTQFGGESAVGEEESKTTVRWIAAVAAGADFSTVALVETEAAGASLVHYQVAGNMELDDSGNLISYEEYSPFSVIVYAAVQGETTALRRFRFARYGETGLYHCGARYYCPWLGRWTSPDPIRQRRRRQSLRLRRQ